MKQWKITLAILAALLMRATPVHAEPKERAQQPLTGVKLQQIERAIRRASRIWFYRPGKVFGAAVPPSIELNGRTIWIADAHRDNGKRFVTRADELLTAFLELESAICACSKFLLTSGRDYAKLGVAKRI